MGVTIKELENNIKDLPENLLDQVNDYVIFLKDRYASDIPEWQKKEVLRREREMMSNPENIMNEDEMETFLNELESEK